MVALLCVLRFLAARRRLFVAGRVLLVGRAFLVESAHFAELGALLLGEDLVELAIDFLLEVGDLLALSIGEIQGVLHERRQDHAGLRTARRKSMASSTRSSPRS